MGTGVAQLRRFHETEHFLCGTAESHDPAGFGVSFSADDLLRAAGAASVRSSPVVAMLLQLRQTSPGAEIRARSQDPGHAGGSFPAATDIQEDLLAGDYFLGKGKVHIGVRPLHNLSRCQQYGNVSRGLTTLDGGSTQMGFTTRPPWTIAAPPVREPS